jgi:sugar lactone lactonase YvrE
MRSHLPIALFLLAGSASPALAQSRGLAYAVDEEGTDHLFAIDLDSGNATDLGAVGFSGVEALAFHPDGRLFGIDETNQQLIVLSLRNGAGTLVASLSLTVEDPGLAIDALGRAWLTSEADGDRARTLFRLDLVLGVMEPVIELPADVHGLSALGATLYGVGSDVEALFRIDPASGELVQVGALVDPIGGQPSLDFDVDGRLLMIDDEGGIHVVDPASGQATQFATTIAGCDAMAISLRVVCAYSVRSDDDDQLYRLDLRTGEAVAIGSTSVSDIEGLAFHPDGRLFGVDKLTDQLFELDLRTGASTLIGSLGFDAVNPGFAIDAGGGGWITTDSGTAPLARVNLTSGAATLVGNVGRASTALAVVGTRLLTVGRTTQSSPEELMRLDPATAAPTVIGPLQNGSLQESGLDATPDGALWGIDDSGVIAVISEATGELVHVAQSLEGFEGLAIPSGCGADERSLRVDSASFDLDWIRLLDGGSPSLGSFQMKGALSRHALPADLTGLRITIETSEGPFFSGVTLDAKGNFRLGRSSGRLDPAKGTLSFSVRDENIGELIELENEDQAGTMLVPLDVRVLDGSTIVAEASARLPFAFESSLNVGASGSFSPKVAPSFTGSAVASTVSAKEGTGDVFDLQMKATLRPEGGGFLVPVDDSGNTRPVVRVRIGDADPVAIFAAALQVTGDGAKAKWKLIGDVPGLKSLSYSAAKGALSIAFEDLASPGIPLAVLDPGGAIEHLLDIEVLVQTAGLPQLFRIVHRLRRSAPESTTWK